MASLTRWGLRRGSVAISQRASRSRGFQAVSGKDSASWDNFRVGIHAKNELYSLAVPAIQLGTERKISVTAQRDLCGTGAQQLNGPIDPGYTAFMADHIPGTVDQVEDFAGLGQSDNQRRVTPDPFIGKSHSPFALSQRPGQRAVGVNKGLLEKISRLLFPDTLPCRVDGFHELQNRIFIKASCKISTGGRIRNALGSQTIQERFIIATQLDILQPLAIEQGVVSQVQYVITLVIRQMPLPATAAGYRFPRLDVASGPSSGWRRCRRSSVPGHVQPSQNGYCWPSSSVRAAHSTDVLDPVDAQFAACGSAGFWGNLCSLEMLFSLAGLA